MNNFKKLLTAVLCFAAMSAYAQLPTEPLKTGIIPKPAQMTQSSGYLALCPNSVIYLDSKFKSLSDYFQDELFSATDIKFNVSTKTPKSLDNSVHVIYDDKLGEEAYIMDINGETVTIKASANGGVIYALQSLRQLIRLNNPLWGHKKIFLPQVSISDKPSFPWRGYMLDVSRTFYPLDYLKESIDNMVKLKLNRFHLHLSDDQGFRVEMVKYPKLNSIGSWRVDHTNFDENDNSVWGRPVQKEGELANYGGYYTREQLKELVAYAKVRNIEILPEIDVPGHAQAIIASYPEFSCEKDKKFTVATGGVRGNNTLCPSTEGTYEFLDAIITELTEIFPFEYIHIGGDECSKNQWSKHDQCTELKKKEGLKDDNELQSYFIHRLEKIVNSKGKKMVGWDEILDGGLAPNATVMSWRGESGGIAAAKMNHDVIMSPSHSNYLDLKQGQSLSEPNLGYSQALMSNTYNFKIIPDEIPEEQRKYVLGNQGNMWTETFSTTSMLSYMAFPRLFAVAENVWTPQSEKGWDDFIERLKPHMDIMAFEGVRFAKSVFNPWVHHKGENGKIKFWFTSEISNPEIRYTLDGTDPIATSTLYQKDEKLEICKSTTIKVAMFENGKRLGDIITRHYPIHKAAGAKIVIRNAENPEGVEQKDSKLVDLSYGEFLQGGDTHWQTFKEDADIEIIFDEPTDVNSVTISSVRHTLTSLYAAKQIEVYAMVDGKYQKVGDSGILRENITSGRNLFTNKVECSIKDVKSIRVKVLRQATIPQGYIPDLVGRNTVLNIDEIVIL